VWEWIDLRPPKVDLGFVLDIAKFLLMPQSCKLALLLQRVELILQCIDLCPKFLIAVICD